MTAVNPIAVKVWDLDRRPHVTAAERRTLAEQHQPRRTITRPAGYDPKTGETLRDEDGATIYETVPLDPPECLQCGEVWGTDGCPTMRLVQVLACAEHDVEVAREAKREAQRIAASVASRPEWHRVLSDDTIRVQVTVAAELLVARHDPRGLMHGVFEQIAKAWDAQRMARGLGKVG